MLNPYDIVGVSFWLITVVMLMATVFLWLERQSVALQWRLPITLSILVVLLSLVHYCEMTKIWMAQQNVALSFRYLEWMVSIPLQLCMVYFVLQVGSRRDCSLWAQLMFIPIAILLLGFSLEQGMLSYFWSTGLITLFWGYLLYVLWAGRGARSMLAMGNISGRHAYCLMRYVITVGWIVYPLGYYLNNTHMLDSDGVNALLNIADGLNKIAVVMIVWHAAYKDSGLFHSD